MLRDNSLAHKQEFSSTFSSKFRWHWALQISAELAWFDQWLRWSWPAVFSWYCPINCIETQTTTMAVTTVTHKNVTIFQILRVKTMKKNALLQSLSDHFNFCAFCNRSRPIYHEKCRCLNDVRTCRQIANLQTADSKHFASQRTWNNQGMITMTRSCIFSLHHPRLSSLNISMEKKKNTHTKIICWSDSLAPEEKTFPLIFRIKVENFENAYLGRSLSM